MEEFIQIRGARVNNLKNIDLDIPLKKITCLAGPSGCGKSSLAFHTLFNESKRRFLNSFPTYLKFFSDRPAPVDVDEISPVLPVFGLPQINPIVGTRAVVADTMHLTETLQNLFFLFSREKCPEHHVVLEPYDVSVNIKKLTQDYQDEDIFYLVTTKDSFIDLLVNTPFPTRSIKSKRSKSVEDFDKDHQYWELLRFKKKGVSRISKKLVEYKDLPLETYLVASKGGKLVFFDIQLEGNDSCPVCGHEGVGHVALAHFSPYNALGACSECNGFGATLEYDEEKLMDMEKSVVEGGARLLEYKRFGGISDDLISVMKKLKISTTKPLSQLPAKFFEILYEGKAEYCGYNALLKYMEGKRYKANVRIFLRGIQKEVMCTSCMGSRLKPHTHNFHLFKENFSYQEVWGLTIEELKLLLEEKKLLFNDPKEEKLVNKLKSILEVATGLGLGHLSLNRKSKSLSAGEYQRLLLLKYLSYEGTNSLFVFDEPSLGLSESEQKMLLDGFRKLKKQGNTVLLIDHSSYFQKTSDNLVIMGPGSGAYGGEILFKGKYSQSKLLHKAVKVEAYNPENKKTKWIKVERPTVYGKEFMSYELPIGGLTCVYGESGTGKSASLINVLANSIHHSLTGDNLNISKGSAKKISIPHDFSDVIVVDSNLNRYTSRSTVGSLTELFSIVRKHFLKTPIAKSMGLKDGHLSSNSNLGQCPSCEGSGVKVIEMQFLEDVVLTCEDCQGKKIKPAFAEISDGNMTVHEAYNKPISEILDHVELTPKFRRIWDYLKLLKLDYLSLDRKINSLSGGERQRIYLLSKLLKRVDNSILFFENLSFGLSDNEVAGLSEFLQKLCDQGNTVIVIDQHKLFKKAASNLLNFSRN
jgi:excinuclease ABC subunit A